MAIRDSRGRFGGEKLRALIDADRDGAGVVACRSGKINRAHYARLLGCSRTTLNYYLDVFTEYERDLKVATGPVRHLRDMRTWLTNAYREKQLEFSDGKLERMSFALHFQLRGGTFITRHPAIRALWEEFDDLARRDNYLPLAKQEGLKRLSRAMDLGPPLNKDRLTINLTALAEVIQVPRLWFRDRLYASAIKAAESNLLVNASSSRIDPFLHGRVFPFSTLTPLWPTSFLERVGIAFKQGASSLSASSAKHSYLALVNAFAWFGESTSIHYQNVLRETKTTAQILSIEDWEEALYSYRDHLIFKIASKLATHGEIESTIKALRMGIALLRLKSVVPETSAPLTGVKFSRRRQHLRSVAEVGSTDSRQADYVDFARKSFQSACQASGAYMASDESSDFLNGLTTELTSLSTELPKDAATAIKLVLERRLNALRDNAQNVIDGAMNAHRGGQNLLHFANIDGESFERDYFGGTLSAIDRTALLRAYFPRPEHATEDENKRGVANLLALITQRYGGIPPEGGAREMGPTGQFFAKRYLSYGGLRTIAPMLHPSSDAIGAALTLYLLDSGANISVGRTLDRECCEPSDLEQYKRITGNKLRAKGKPIIVDLPETSPSIRAIAWLLSAGDKFPSSATQDVDKLFLMRVGGQVQLMTPNWYTNWFKAFASKSPGLKGLHLLPNMIRPSVLLHAALSNDGRLATGSAIGQHTEVETQGYQQKWPTRLIYDTNIRKFTSAFETLVLSGVEDAASRLGITATQFEARLGDLRPTGLGTFCRDQRKRPGIVDQCSMDCWNECPNLLIVAEVEAVSALQIWQASLRSAQPEWERERPERWDEVWLPWLCLTDVVEEKMVRGSLIKIWNEARERTSILSSQPGYVPPKPW